MSKDIPMFKAKHDSVPPFSSSSTSHVQEEPQQPRQQQQQSSTTSNHVNISIDVCSFLVVLITFWFFASMTIFLYGSVDLQLGSNYSRLIRTNSIVVQSIEVEELG